MEKDEKWLARLDEAKKRFGIDSDVILATTVGISPAMLAHVRAGRRPLPLSARLRLIDKLGYAISRDWLLEILPDDVRAVISELDNGRLDKKMRKKTLQRSTDQRR